MAISSTQPDVKLVGCVICADLRGINMYSESGCSNATLELSSTSVFNSRIADLDNTTTVGDTRGIALYGVVDSQIKILNGSAIKGFGYSVNTSNDTIDGVKAGSNTYTVTNSSIIGWSAFNVHTVKNTFNITNSTLKGISNLNSEWDNFATFAINDGIYNGESENANVVNIYGGAVEAYATGTANHACFFESSESLTQFNFFKYFIYNVELKFPQNSGTFAVYAPGTDVNISGSNNVTA